MQIRQTPSPVRTPAFKVVPPQPAPTPAPAPRPAKQAEPGPFARMGAWLKALVARLRGEAPEPPRVEKPGAGWMSLDPERDRLAVTVKPGMTMYQFARLYGPETGLGEFVKEMQRANGMADAAIAPGQVIQVPIGGSANWKVAPLAAVQRSLADRRKAGAEIPEFDYTRFEIDHGPYHSLVVHLGEDRQRFHVVEDMSGDVPYGYRVMLADEADEAFKAD